MAHSFKVVTVPHTNKDGSASKTKKDHYLYDRTHRGTVFMGKCSSKKELEAQAEKVTVPLSYADELYALRNHIHLVRKKLLRT